MPVRPLPHPLPHSLCSSSVADELFCLADPGFFPTVCDCATRRDIARELALEELERLRAEGLLTEPESDDGEDEAVDLARDVRAAGTTARATAVEAEEGEAMAVEA